jgi:hypothetical protein
MSAEPISEFNTKIGLANVENGHAGSGWTRLRVLKSVIGVTDADADVAAAFKPVLTVTGPVQSAALGRIPASAFAGSPVWIVRLVVHHKNGRTREARFRLQLG